MVRPDLIKDGGYRCHSAGSQVGQALVGLHQGQITVRTDGEQVEHLIEHLAMLAGDTHDYS